MIDLKIEHNRTLFIESFEKSDNQMETLQGCNRKNKAYSFLRVIFFKFKMRVDSIAKYITKYKHQV